MKEIPLALYQIGIESIEIETLKGKDNLEKKNLTIKRFQSTILIEP